MPYREGSANTSGDALALPALRPTSAMATALPCELLDGVTKLAHRGILAPAVVLLISFLAVYHYPITREKHAQIRAELARRKSSSQP